ncbi:MAG: peptidoglycan-associated outer rane lipoprotein [Myxococcaceae bacterium]|nr:peptidoglycan-associated outer rane lipoprotein [Myxococcaceae bacterium]
MKVLFAATACFALTGCPPTYPKCDSDANCTEKGEVCVQGQCQECAVDANCKPGFVCDANKCVPKPECTDKNPCKAGAKCKQGKCAVEAGAKDGTSSTNEDSPSGEECKAGKCAAKGGAAGSCSVEPVRFDFNESKLGSEGQAALAALADCIKKNGWKLRVEGHADERGTEEYNLQLSNRRAASVKRYLTDLGVPDAALETVGYGENKPAVSGATEAAWAANRRVELVKR